MKQLAFFLLLVTLNACVSEASKKAEEARIQNLIQQNERNAELARQQKRIDDSLRPIIEAKAEADRIIKEKELEITRNIQLIAQINEKMNEVSNDNMNRFRGSVEDVVEEVTYLQTIENTFLHSYSIKDAEVKKKLKEYDAFVKKIKIKEFPKMRAEYVRISKNSLWEHNIEVSGSGTSITYTGGIFADNANKKEFYETLRGVLYDLRFKRVNFKWYKYDDEYVYYTIESLKDGS